MVKKKISELDDGEATRLSSAVIAFEQGGTTFKASVRPNPTKQINITSQAQLEAELGPNLEIPDFTSVSVVADDSYSQTKPFLVGEGAALDWRPANLDTVVDVSAISGPVVKLLDPTKPAKQVIVDNFLFEGNVNNTVMFDLKLTAFFFVNLIQLSDFLSVGQIECFIVKIEFMGKLNVAQGIVIKNPTQLRIISSPYIVKAGGSSPTSVSVFFDPGFAPLFGFSSTIINDEVSFAFGAGDAIVFFDPNAPAGSTFEILNSAKSGGDLFQQGTDIAINSVADNGSGKTRFTTAVSHGLVVGRAVVLSGFSESTYNITAIVTAVDTPLTGTTFDVDITFIPGLDSGNMNTASLDSTDVQVISKDNPASPDSMSLAEGRSVGTLEVDSIASTLVPIVDVTPVSGDFIEDTATERFTVDLTTGIITYIGLEPITALISYELNAEKTGGSDQDLVISLEKGGVPQPKSDINILATAAPGAFSSSGRKIYDIINGDTFQLFLNNTTNSTNTNISNLALVISKQ